MLGIIHRDERNPQMLRKWLDDIEPDVITFEISRYSLDFRRSAGTIHREKLDRICDSLFSGGRDRRNPHVDSISSYIDMPPEFVTADEYCRRNKIDIYPVDMDLFSFLKLSKIGELIDRDNIAAAMPEGSNPGAREKVLADLYFHKGVTAFTYSEEMAIRDHFICHKITILRKRYKSGRFLHIAGWQHLRDPLSLYDTFKPVKIFLYD